MEIDEVKKFKEIFRNLVESRKDLGYEEAKFCLELIVSGKVSTELISAFLTALHLKGETEEEIAGFAMTMREKAVKPDLRINKNLLADTCGTGGDGLHTFNASTASAILLSAMGIPVAKHGNRAVSSKSGSADILEKVGVKIEIPPDKVGEELSRKNFVFLFAPLYHPVMKSVAPIRKELGIRTIFNLLGPLTNPAEVGNQLIGTISPDFARKIANAVRILRNPQRALIVVGEVNGKFTDEISPCGRTLAIEIKEGKLDEFFIDPDDVGIKRVSLDEILYRGEEEFLLTLQGKSHEALINFVCLNSAGVLYLMGKARDIKEGFEKAKSFILTGKAYDHLKSIITLH